MVLARSSLHHRLGACKPPARQDCLTALRLEVMAPNAYLFTHNAPLLPPQRPRSACVAVVSAVALAKVEAYSPGIRGRRWWVGVGLGGLRCARKARRVEYSRSISARRSPPLFPACNAVALRAGPPLMFSSSCPVTTAPCRPSFRDLSTWQHSIRVSRPSSTEKRLKTSKPPSRRSRGPRHRSQGPRHRSRGPRHRSQGSRPRSRERSRG